MEIFRLTHAEHHICAEAARTHGAAETGLAEPAIVEAGSRDLRIDVADPLRIRIARPGIAGVGAEIAGADGTGRGMRVAGAIFDRAATLIAATEIGSRNRGEAGDGGECHRGETSLYSEFHVHLPFAFRLSSGGLRTSSCLGRMTAHG